MTTNFDFEPEGWEEKEICTKGVVMVKNKERGGVGE